MTVDMLTRFLDAGIFSYFDPPKKKRARLDDDFDEFVEEYESSRREFGLGEWVPARLLAMTGMIMWELTRRGYIQREGDSFKPW